MQTVIFYNNIMLTRCWSFHFSEETASKVIDHLLAAFNSFSASPAVYNARGRLSQLGVCEDIVICHVINA